MLMRMQTVELCHMSVAQSSDSSFIRSSCYVRLFSYMVHNVASSSYRSWSHEERFATTGSCAPCVIRSLVIGSDCAYHISGTFSESINVRFGLAPWLSNNATADTSLCNTASPKGV